MAIGTALDELRSVLAAACPGVPLQDDVTAPAGGAPAALAVVPLSAAPCGRSRGGATALDVLLRCLVVPLGDGALDLLETCLLALEPAPGLDLEAEPPPDRTWAALGVPPRPALVVRRRVPLRVDGPRGPLVTRPLAADAGIGRLLAGRVLGPNDVALSEASVAVDGGAPVRCARDGSFRVLALAGRDPHRLTVSLKGRVLQADVAAGEPEPLIVRCESLEP